MHSYCSRVIVSHAHATRLCTARGMHLREPRTNESGTSTETVCWCKNDQKPGPSLPTK